MIQLKVDIRDKHQTQFEELKKHWKFTSNTDTIRYMINYNWEQEINQNKKFLEIQDELLSEIKSVIGRKDIQQEYYIYSVTDFANAAIKNLLTQIKSKKKSLFDWDFRSTLSADELIVTKAIGKIQDSRSSNDFSFNLLLHELEWRNQEKLRQILDNFENNSFISSNIIDDEKIYHAYSP